MPVDVVPLYLNVRNINRARVNVPSFIQCLSKNLLCCVCDTNNYFYDTIPMYKKECKNGSYETTKLKLVPIHQDEEFSALVEVTHPFWTFLTEVIQN